MFGWFGWEQERQGLINGYMSKVRELHAADDAAVRYHKLYLDLRRRVAAFGVDPMKGVLEDHDRRMRQCGIEPDPEIFGMRVRVDPSMAPDTFRIEASER